MIFSLPIDVGMTRFELATPRPPDAYSNRTELHPEHRPERGFFRFAGAKVLVFFDACKFFPTFVADFAKKDS